MAIPMNFSILMLGTALWGEGEGSGRGGVKKRSITSRLLDEATHACMGKRHMPPPPLGVSHLFSHSVQNWFKCVVQNGVTD